MYNILKIKLGDKEAKALTEYVENHVEKSFEKEHRPNCNKRRFIEIRC
jgi:hypothetical protein